MVCPICEDYSKSKGISKVCHKCIEQSFRYAKTHVPELGRGTFYEEWKERKNATVGI